MVIRVTAKRPVIFSFALLDRQVSRRKCANASNSKQETGTVSRYILGFNPRWKWEWRGDAFEALCVRANLDPVRTWIRIVECALPPRAFVLAQRRAGGTKLSALSSYPCAHDRYPHDQWPCAHDASHCDAIGLPRGWTLPPAILDFATVF